MANPAKSSLRFNTFGSIAYDGNRVPIGVSASTNYFMTIDATATPQKSPLAITSSITTLIIPAAALGILLTSSTAFNVSEDPLMASYFTVPANTPVIFPCITPDIDNATANTGNIYLSTASAATVSFLFQNV